MSAIRFDNEQRFTCSSCARCCHTEVVVTPGERAVYEKARAERWFREADDAAEGAARDPFEPLAGRPGWFRIRRRPDGTCGFLSPQNLCRLHQELGGDRKPLVCRIYPFAMFRTERETVAKAAFSCPTIAVNEGEPVGTQQRALGALWKDWERDFGREAKPLELIRGRPLDARALATMRDTLLRLLSRADESGGIDLALNVRRMAAWVEDLARSRVTRLPPDDFSEYVTLTGKYAAESDRAVPAPSPSALSRLFARGFLFIVATTELQRERPHASGLQLELRWRLFRNVTHAHALGPATRELQMSARGLRLDPDAAPMVRHYLRAAIATLGTGRRPVLDELAMAAAILNAAIAIGAMKARADGDERIGPTALQHGIATAATVGHIDGTVAQILGNLTGGPDAFHLLAAAL
jgi:Fe-S-cluster containining protein